FGAGVLARALGGSGVAAGAALLRLGLAVLGLGGLLALGGFRVLAGSGLRLFAFGGLVLLLGFVRALRLRLIAVALAALLLGRLAFRVIRDVGLAFARRRVLAVLRLGVFRLARRRVLAVLRLGVFGLAGRCVLALVAFGVGPGVLAVLCFGVRSGVLAFLRFRRVPRMLALDVRGRRAGRLA